MSDLKTPFRYDYVGSFLRPEKLKKARADYEAGTISAEQLKSVEDECIVQLVNKIKELGYHVITDGEFRRATWHLDFMWGFQGIEHKKTVDGNTTFDASPQRNLILKTKKRSWKESNRLRNMFRWIGYILAHSVVLPHVKSEINLQRKNSGQSLNW